jgi:hypothetical protein
VQQLHHHRQRSSSSSSSGGSGKLAEVERLLRPFAGMKQ